MTTTFDGATAPGASSGDTGEAWHTPQPGPIAVIAKPHEMLELARALRAEAARHHDNAWLHPNPTVRTGGATGGQRGGKHVGTGSRRSKLPTLGKELLDAIGCVGLATPRRYGETHLLRPLTHLIHGPVRHVLVHDAILVHLDDLLELHQAALIARVQLWLLIDPADTPALTSRTSSRRAPTAEVLEWIDLACSPCTTDEALGRWRNRPNEAPDCVLPAADWWQYTLDPGEPLPAACRHHPQRVDCLLRWIRRALTAGHTTPTMIRAVLRDYADHPDTTVEDRWALTAAGRDLYTPASDALAQLGLDATKMRLSDVAHDGSAARDPDDTVVVHPAVRPALSRLRTSRALAGCLPHEPLLGVFDEARGDGRVRR